MDSGNTLHGQRIRGVLSIFVNMMCGNGPYWAKSVTSNNFFLKNVQKITEIAQIDPFR